MTPSASIPLTTWWTMSKALGLLGEEADYRYRRAIGDHYILESPIQSGPRSISTRVQPLYKLTVTLFLCYPSCSHPNKQENKTRHYVIFNSPVPFYGALDLSTGMFHHHLDFGIIMAPYMGPQALVLINRRFIGPIFLLCTSCSYSEAPI